MRDEVEEDQGEEREEEVGEGQERYKRPTVRSINTPKNINVKLMVKMNPLNHPNTPKPLWQNPQEISQMHTGI